MFAKFTNGLLFSWKRCCSSESSGCICYMNCFASRALEVPTVDIPKNYENQLGSILLKRLGPIKNFFRLFGRPKKNRTIWRGIPSMK